MAADRKNHLKSVHIEVTRSCNLRCKYCLIEKDNMRLERDRFLLLLDELVDLGTFTITLTGGEPFVEKDVFYLIEQARDKGFKVGILTNGTLITREVAQRLSDCGVLDIKVSLYGASEDTYENFTGRREAKKALQGVRNLTTTQVRTSLLYNINTITYKDAPIIKRVFGSMDRVKLRFTAGVSPSRDCDFSLLKYELPFEELHQKLKQWGIEIREYEKILEQPPQLNDPMPCRAGIDKCYIAADGRVLPCALYPVEVGNIYEQSLEEIWNGSEYLSRLRKLRIDDFGDCKVCELREVCQFRCPALSEMRTGNPTKCPEDVLLQARRLNSFLKGGNYGKS